jgi:hypothetical protein
MAKYFAVSPPAFPGLRQNPDFHVESMLVGVGRTRIFWIPTV